MNTKAEPRDRFWLWFWIWVAVVQGCSDSTARRYAREAQADVDALRVEVKTLRAELVKPEPPQ